jgi:hypothetical protein
VPNATFTKLLMPARAVKTVRLAFSIGSDPAAAATVEQAVAANVTAFQATWSAAARKWEERWNQAFTPNNGFFSGHLPTLDLAGSGDAGAGRSGKRDVNAELERQSKPHAPQRGADTSSTGASSANNTTVKAETDGATTNTGGGGGSHATPGAGGVARVFYMAILTALSELRTNLPLAWSRAFENGNGNVGHTTMGIGGSRSWWWDEALTSMMFALLEPEGACRHLFPTPVSTPLAFVCDCTIC